MNRIFRNKWAVIVVLIGAVFFVLSANYFASWFFLKEMENTLDRELGRRLEAVASLTARVIESDVLTASFGQEIDELNRPILRDVLALQKQENQLQAAFLTDMHFQVISAFPEIYETGQPLTHLVSDSLQMRVALKGVVVSSPLYAISGHYFKSAYAPLRNSLGTIIGLVIVEASADYFTLLQQYERGLVYGGFVVALVFALLSAFIYWSVTRFARFQQSMQRHERLAAMGQMAATVAHEIRNPLGIIKNTAEILRRKYAEEQDDELLQFIPSEVDRLNRLVSDFLEFARDRELQIEPNDLVETIRRAIDDIRHEASAQDVDFAFRKEFERLIVPHNPDAIRQVMFNLILNAVQAMEGKGRVTVLLNYGTHWGRKQVLVSIIDTGPGLPADSKTIFEPFFTTKTSGSGLGLAVSNQIIEKHGGVLTAENGEQGGTIFQFSLPL